MPRLSSDDYRELAASYESDPPRRSEMIGEPELSPRPDQPNDEAPGDSRGD